MAGGSSAWFGVTAFVSYPLAIWLGRALPGGDLVSSLAVASSPWPGYSGGPVHILRYVKYYRCSLGQKARSIAWSAVPPRGFALLLALYVPLAVTLTGWFAPW